MIRKLSTIWLPFAVFLICQSLEAQSTWGGLQFGMTPAQVRGIFRMPVHEASGVEMVRDFPYTLVSEQQVGIQKIGFTPRFSFDDKRRLQLVTLYSLKDDPALNIDIARHFAEALSGKYGPPVIQKEVCGTDTPNQVCRSTWRDGSQRITLVFQTRSDLSLGFMFLAYEVNPTDL
jgi:hypothetical protein